MPLNIDWQQILLHLFNFVILFAILYFLLYKPVKQFMEKRTAYYKEMDEQAKENLSVAEKTKEEYQNRLASVEEEISGKKEEAYRQIEQERMARLDHAEQEAAKIIADAHKNIESDRRKMLKEAQTQITDMVVTAAGKIAAPATTSEAFDQFLDAAKRSDDHE